MRPETERRERLLRWLFALLALVVPVLAGYTILYQWRTSMLGFYRDGSEPPVVALVMPGGPAKAAGLQAGDVILTVNGVPSATGFDRQLGPAYTLEIVRDGQPLTLVVPLASMLQVNRWPLISAVFVALIFWGAGLLLLWRRFRRQDVRLFFLLCQAFGLALLPGLAYPRFRLPPPWMVFLEFACFYLAVLLFLHFHLTFPVVLGSPRQRRWALGLLYGLALAAAVDGLSRPAPWTSPTAFYIVLESAAAIGVVVYVYFCRASADGRRRLRVVVAGTVLGVAPPVLGYVIPTFVQGYTPDVPRWLVSLCLAIVPLSYLYAAARHNLFGLDRLLNRALVYALLSLGIFGLYLGPLLLLFHFLPGDPLLQTAVVAGLTLLVGLTFDGSRRRVQRLVDKLFYGGWYDYPGVVETVSEALARSLDREQLSDLLIRQVPDLMQLHPGHLRLDAPPIYQPANPPGLPFPLTFEGQVQGLWTVGSRRDGEAFSASDRRILQTLARQAETALSNVLLVERLRRRVDEIRQVQRQLLRSREEERARLARDLHDGPIQALVGLNLQLGLLQNEWGGLAIRPTPLAEALGAMRAEVRGLLSELRQVCAELRPPMLDTLGLGAALRALAEEWSAQQGVAVHLELPPNAALRPLPEDVAVNLYRVVQEALANVARHAAARRVAIRLTWEEPRLTLAVQDDGRGFVAPDDLHDLAAGGHFGLVGMGERVNLIGGAWTVESAPDRGTTVRVVWQRPEPMLTKRE